MGQGRLAKNMEKAHNERIKTTLLACFVIVSVALIFVLWVNAFSDEGADNPYFYRETPQRSDEFNLTLTAIEELESTGTGTPTVDHIHKNAPPTATPTPTPTPTINLLFTPEADN
jgi:heme/copper-type cytochrome/quinol oxidase subunit 2